MEFTGSELSEHNKIKIERHIKAERLQLEEEGIDNTKINESLSLRKKELENLATLKDWKCPKNRFGRTELQMPIITLGGMRQQQTWSPPDSMSLDDIKLHVWYDLAIAPFWVPFRVTGCQEKLH